VYLSIELISNISKERVLQTLNSGGGGRERERERESLCHHLKKRESPHHPILEKEKTSIVW